MTGLQRTKSCSAAIKTTTKIIPSSISAHHLRSSSDADNFSGKFLLQKNSSHRCHRQHLAASTTGKFSSLLHSLLKLLSIPTCKWLSIPTHLSVSPSSAEESLELSSAAAVAMSPSPSNSTPGPSQFCCSNSPRQPRPSSRKCPPVSFASPSSPMLRPPSTVLP
ncbi:hypothetical protein SDJN03_12227, partial [Cucurbita argyrosperma subsp. sororia]